MDALEQALHDRQPDKSAGLIHHSDRGLQYVSIKHTERLGEMSIRPSVGRSGDAYDNTLAETINVLYKTELIHRGAPWKSRAAVKLASWIGCSGSIISACLAQSAIFHPSRQNNAIISNLKYPKSKPFYFDQLASSIPRTIHARYL